MEFRLIKQPNSEGAWNLSYKFNGKSWNYVYFTKGEDVTINGQKIDIHPIMDSLESLKALLDAEWKGSKPGQDVRINQCGTITVFMPNIVRYVIINTDTGDITFYDFFSDRVKERIFRHDVEHTGLYDRIYEEIARLNILRKDLSVFKEAV